MHSFKSITTTIVALLSLAASLAAQEPQCAMPDPNATAACNTAVDAIRAFHPLAGMIVSGGNPVLGTATSLGGIGHLTVTARVNAIKASLPNPDSASQSQVPSSFRGAIPAPIVEAALGLLRGRGGFLSVDALGSAVLLPTSGVAGLSVDSNAAHIGGAALGIGYGARVGILSGTFPIPALSVSWRRRAPLRLLANLPNGRRWGAPSTSRCEVGGASRQIPSSARSSCRVGPSPARGFTRNSGGRMRKSWRSGPRARGRAARPWW